MKTGRVESVIEGCVALRKRDWRKVSGRAVLHWSDFDGQEQTEADSGTDKTGPSVSQTTDPENHRPHTAGAGTGKMNSQLNWRGYALACMSCPQVQIAVTGKSEPWKNRRSALALYTHLLEQ